MNEDPKPITLRLEGARAKRGVSLSDFETFIDSFLAALRDFDRDQRGAPTKKSGHPEARAAAVTSFRLVGFRQGSGIATIEPEVTQPEDGAARMLDTEPVQMINLRALLSSLDREEPLPDSVIDPLEKAVKSAGDDGVLSVEVPNREGRAEDCPPITIDTQRIARIRAATQTTPPRLVTSISGRLHQVDFEPDKLAIRASDGVDWACTYPEELENQVEALVNKFVWATGSGALQSPRRGSMKLAEIRAVEEGIQAGLFSGEPVSESDLAARQGITAPQGLEALGAAEWTEADDAYLSALTEK